MSCRVVPVVVVAVVTMVTMVAVGARVRVHAMVARVDRPVVNKQTLPTRTLAEIVEPVPLVRRGVWSLVVAPRGDVKGRGGWGGGEVVVHVAILTAMVKALCEPSG